jgi:hypothetical protein
MPNYFIFPLDIVGRIINIDGICGAKLVAKIGDGSIAGR